MKLRVALQLPDGGTHDVTLTCDVTATVADLARTLIELGLGSDPMLPRLAGLRPVTVCGRSAANASPRLLDPGDPIVASGLQSGWTIEPVAEFGAADAIRIVEPAGYLEVLEGEQQGTLFSLLPGPNVVGRDRAARVHLSDRSVSRRHALLGIDKEGRAWLQDLGSANGSKLRVNDAPVDPSGATIRGPTQLQLGNISVRVTPGAPHTGACSLAAHRIVHVRAPRVETRFAESSRPLPAPPAQAKPTRVPLLALLAPALMGGVLFGFTGSPMSLMMAAFSPVMMLGSWADNKFGSRRKLRREEHEFRAALTVERAELEALFMREIEVRAGETPAVPEIAEAAYARSGLLWARRPEHRAFLEVRFGEGALPSRTSVQLPERGDSSPGAWRAVRELAAEFTHADPVPVLERLDSCGAIGVAGEPEFAAAMARSLVLQLAGLHSPEELVLACFAGAEAKAAWDWLKWLPHVDTVTSPIPAWQLADDAASTTRLLVALEGLIEVRAHGGGHGGGGGARGGGTPGDGSHSGGVSGGRHLPAVVVLVLTSAYAVPARLIALAEDGPAVGVHVIWVAPTQADLPAACHTFVVLGQASGEVGYVKEHVCVALTRIEHVDTPVAVRLARALAPIEDAAARALDESDLPRAAQLRDLHPVDLTAGAAPILQAWQSTLGWVRGAEREPVSLAAPVGQGPEGPAMIDLRLHGPHALVGGTTGAGKSEFLQSWIMSLATLVSPERLTFLLVDYKGGAAFAECVELPHTVGLVTDLSPHLVRRALTSLRAELRYREELLAEHGAKDLATMERRSDPAAPPTLVIVVDEFAALASEVPEFVDGVVDVAQRGRSLGLHLILATQRPAGVIKDNLRANTNLRVALRMADEADSSDVIGVKDAAYFAAETPGRGAIKVGPGRMAHFQAGYLGGRQVDQAPAATLELRSLGFSEGPALLTPAGSAASAPASFPPGATESRHANGERDIERLRDGIVAAAQAAGTRPPRRPWLDALPEKLDLESLAARGQAKTRAQTQTRAQAQTQPGREPADDTVTVGLQDLPEQQAQRPVRIDLERAGNIAIFGAGGSGKTSALIALAAELARSAGTYPVELYALDAAGGALDAIRSLPAVGVVAQLADTELVGRVLHRVHGALTERASRYAAARCSGLAAYRHTDQGEPRIVLLIDGFSALRQAAEGVGGPIAQMQQIAEIMATGRAAGVHVVLTADRPGAIPAALGASVQQQFVLRLANPHDYAQFGVPADVLEGAPAGRAVIADGAKRGAQGVSELQFGLIGGEPELAAQARALAALGAHLRAAGLAEVPTIHKAPDRVPLGELPAEARGRPVFGIGTAMAEPGVSDAAGAAGVARAADTAGAAGTVGVAGAAGAAGAAREGDSGAASSGFLGFAPVTMPSTGLGVIAGPAGAGLSTAAQTCAVAFARWTSARGEPVRRILLTFAQGGPRLHPGESARITDAPGSGSGSGSGADAGAGAGASASVGSAASVDSAAGGGGAACAAAAAAAADTDEACSSDADVTGTAGAAHEGHRWDLVACGAEEVAAMARELTLELGGRPPRAAISAMAIGAGIGTPVQKVSGDLVAGAANFDNVGPLGPDPEHQASRAPAARSVIVVERPAEAEGTPALAELAALAKAARRADALVLFEFEQGTGSAIWDLLAALKQPTWGLALQPDEGDSQSPFRERLGRVNRTDFVPGRGFMIEGGRVTPVHVALA